MAMYLTRKTWNPTNETLALSDVMDRLMRNAFVSPNGANVGAPALDASETPESYTVKAALPGWKPENVDVSFENGVLWLNIPKAEVVKPRQIKIAVK